MVPRQGSPLGRELSNRLRLLFDRVEGPPGLTAAAASSPAQLSGIGPVVDRLDTEAEECGHLGRGQPAGVEALRPQRLDPVAFACIADGDRAEDGACNRGQALGGKDLSDGGVVVTVEHELLESGTQLRAVRIARRSR